MTTPDVKQVVDGLRHILRTVPPIQFIYPDRNSLAAAIALIERLTTEANELRAKVEELERDARRYRWLRRYRAIDVHKPLPSIPWAVRCEADHGAPTMTMCHGLVLDTAIDSAIDSAMGDANG